MLPKSHRLRLTRDFERIFAVRRASNSVFFRAKVLPNKLSLTRFAVVVSSKISKRAVIRNRVRRRAWAVISEHFLRLPKGFDIVLIALPEAARADFISVHQELTKLLSKPTLFS